MSINSLKSIFIAGMLIGSICSNGQISSEEFLFQDLLAKDQGLEVYGDALKLPWIEAYDLRTETRNFDLDQQEFTVRLTPNSIKKRKAQQALGRHLTQVPNFRMEEERCRIVQSRYEDWLNLYLLEQEETLLIEEMALLEDKETVLNKLTASGDYDVEDMIDVYTDKADIQLALLKLRSLQSAIVDRYLLDEMPLDFSDFASIEQIKRFLINHTLGRSDLSKYDYESQLLGHELALEQAESKQVFDFVQMRYVGPHSDLLEERLSLGVGLAISNSGNRKLKIRELEMQQVETNLRKDLDMARRSNYSDNKKGDLLSQISHFEAFQEIKNSETAHLDLLVEQIADKEGFNPLSLIRIEQKKLKRKADEFKLIKAIYSEYLDFIGETEQVCETEVNYFQQH